MEKVSVVIIAHNEGGNVQACLKSVLRQSLLPDEIILIAHNCTDDTVARARAVQNKLIRIIEYSGPEGIVFARVRGFEEADGEIVVCLDGDSRAIGKKWLRKLIKPFFKDPSRTARSPILAVGGGVLLWGGLIPFLMSLDFFWLKPIYKFFTLKSIRYFWGANFAIRKSMYEKIGGLIPFIRLIQKLGLSLAPEDLYLALRVSEVGEVAIEPWAVVLSMATKTNWKIRSQIQGRDKQKLVS